MTTAQPLCAFRPLDSHSDFSLPAAPHSFHPHFTGEQTEALSRERDLPRITEMTGMPLPASWGCHGDRVKLESIRKVSVSQTSYHSHGCYYSCSFPRSSVGKDSACNAGDPGLIPGSGRSSGEGNDNPLQYSRLENPMDRGVWQATVHGVARVRHDLVTKPKHSLIRTLFG